MLSQASRLQPAARVRNPCLTWANLCSIIDGMGIASTEIRRISSTRPRLSVAAEVSGSLVSGATDSFGGGTLPVLPALRERLPPGGLGCGLVGAAAGCG